MKQRPHIKRCEGVFFPLWGLYLSRKSKRPVMMSQSVERLAVAKVFKHYRRTHPTTGA